MTKNEADAVVAVIATADGGCTSCSFALAEELTVMFPQYDWEGLLLAYNEVMDEAERGSSAPAATS